MYAASAEADKRNQQSELAQRKSTDTTSTVDLDIGPNHRLTAVARLSGRA